MKHDDDDDDGDNYEWMMLMMMMTLMIKIITMIISINIIIIIILPIRKCNSIWQILISSVIVNTSARAAHRIKFPPIYYDFYR